DATFGALADPTRRAILARLAHAPESTVGELAAPFSISLPAISRHLRVLEGAGLIEREKDGRVHHCRIVAGPMRTASDWIERYRQFWEERLDALKLYLENTPEEEDERWKPRRSGSRSRKRSGPRGRGSSGRGRSPN